MARDGGGTLYLKIKSLGEIKTGAWESVGRLGRGPGHPILECGRIDEGLGQV